MIKKKDNSIVKQMYLISNNYFLIKEVLNGQLLLIEELSSTLSSTLKIDPLSVIVLCLITEYSSPGGRIKFEEIESLIRLGNNNLGTIQKAIDELAKNQYVKIYDSEDQDEITFSLSDKMEKMISKFNERKK